MSYGKARKKDRNKFKKRLKIYNTYNAIEDEKTYDFKDKPSIKGTELKELFKQRYKWL